MLKPVSRWIILACAFLMVGALIWPFWKITLVAPQYPEGLVMFIYPGGVKGEVELINGLNHYIGMKEIINEDFKEFKILPYWVGALIILGLVTFFTGKRKWLWVWLIALIATGVIGMADFWRWEYDYGHNLNPSAAIKIPGMSYQPPLIGYKQLLNFLAGSFPGLGGYLIIIPGIVVGLVLVYEIKTKHSRYRVNNFKVPLKRIIPISFCITLFAFTAGARTIVVSPSLPVNTLQKAVQSAHGGDTILVKKAVYTAVDVVINKPLVLMGENYPVLDGQFKNEILIILADSVTIKGFQIQNTKEGTLENYAGIRCEKVRDVLIESNMLIHTLFPIYLPKSQNCIVRNNTIVGKNAEYASGGGIYLWYSSGILIENNQISGQRDGIYFEFSNHCIVRRNTSTGNFRYGLHFMFSNNNLYEDNIFKNNGSGVAVMYSDSVVMTANRFEHNWGAASYGLLLKEIRNSKIEKNEFLKNTTGILLEGATHIKFEGNLFSQNGYALNIMTDCIGNNFQKNIFTGNTFDVATNGSPAENYFDRNYWDKYAGYDLNKDQIGDIPFYPVSLYSKILESIPAAIVLLRSFIVELLDKVQSAVPSLIPATIVDHHPLMKTPKIT